MEIQKGSLVAPIIIHPRIDGNLVTQSQIKNDFSNLYIDDNTTPIAFAMELKVREEVIQTISWDELKSTETDIFFLPPNSIYDEEKKYTVLFYWTISTEKVYTKIPITLEVKDFHNEQ